MEPISMTALIIQVLLKYGPAAAQEVQLIFATEKPTDEQWASVFKITRATYSDYVNPVA
jgi:hypothetical protein